MQQVTFTFGVAKNNASIWRVYENLKLAVKQCYQTGELLKDKNQTIQIRLFE